MGGDLILYNLTLKTAPTTEPISLTEAKNYLRLDAASGASDITEYQSIIPATKAIGAYAGDKVTVSGYSASIVINSGTIAGVGTLIIKLQDSNDDITWTDVYTFTTINAANDNAIYTYEYTGQKTYVRAYATVALDTATFGVNINILVGDTAENAYITALIVAARKFCENYQNRAYITQAWELSLDYFDNEIIEIPKGRLQTIDSITYKDYTAVTATIPNTEYVYSTRGILGRLTPAYGKTWPVFTPYPLDAVVITFTCGYGSAANVPETVKQAMYLLISHWYENRLPLADKMTVSDELNFTISALLWQERIVIL